MPGGRGLLKGNFASRVMRRQETLRLERHNPIYSTFSVVKGPTEQQLFSVVTQLKQEVIAVFPNWSKSIFKRKVPIHDHVKVHRTDFQPG